MNICIYMYLFMCLNVEIFKTFTMLQFNIYVINFLLVFTYLFIYLFVYRFVFAHFFVISMHVCLCVMSYLVKPEYRAPV